MHLWYEYAPYDTIETIEIGYTPVDGWDEPFTVWMSCGGCDYEGAPIAAYAYVDGKDIPVKSSFTGSSALLLNEETENYPNWINFAPTNVARADGSGYSTFEDLTLLDTSQRTVSVRFKFYVGDMFEDRYMISDMSYKPYKYTSKEKFKLGSSYSKSIAANQAFFYYPEVKVTITNANVEYYTVKAQLKKFNGEELYNAAELTERYVDGHVCLIEFDPTFTYDPWSNWCYVDKLSQDGSSPMEFKVGFNWLNFVKSGISANLVFSFSSDLQHEFNYAESSTISVETQPAIVRFEEEPPTEVKINDLFQFVVKVEINSGSALERTLVRCNVTEYFTQRTIQSSFFGGMAAESLTIERTNALAPSVEIEQTRSEQITDEDGEAGFNMKILRARNNLEVAVICESQGVKSSLSRLITIQNDVATVRIDNHFSEEIDVDYMTNSADEIQPTPVTLSSSAMISILDEDNRPVEDIDPSEIRVMAISYKQAVALFNQNKTATSQTDEAVTNEDEEQISMTNEMKDLMLTLVKGSNTVGKLFP